MRSPIPAAVARRIDRASQAAHRFHRYAHHPLCGAYQSEVLRLGALHLCRGCVFVATGATGGGLLGVLLSPLPLVGAGLLVVGMAMALAGTRLRWPKAWSRFVPAACLGASIPSSFLVALAALSLSGLLVLAYRRRGPNRSACASCVERTKRVCSGFAPIVRRERAFARLAHRWLAAPSSASLIDKPLQ